MIKLINLSLLCGVLFLVSSYVLANHEREEHEGNTTFVFSRAKAATLRSKFSELLDAPKVSYQPLNSLSSEDDQIIFVEESQGAISNQQSPRPVICTNNAFDCVVLAGYDQGNAALAHIKREIDFDTLELFFEKLSKSAVFSMASSYCSDLALDVLMQLKGRGYTDIFCDFPEVFYQAEIDNSSFVVNELKRSIITIDPDKFPTKECLGIVGGCKMTIDSRTGYVFDEFPAIKDFAAFQERMRTIPERFRLHQKVDSSFLMQALHQRMISEKEAKLKALQEQIRSLLGSSKS